MPDNVTGSLTYVCQNSGQRLVSSIAQNRLQHDDVVPRCHELGLSWRRRLYCAELPSSRQHHAPGRSRRRMATRRASSGRSKPPKQCLTSLKAKTCMHSTTALHWAFPQSSNQSMNSNLWVQSIPPLHCSTPACTHGSMEAPPAHLPGAPGCAAAARPRG